MWGLLGNKKLVHGAAGAKPPVSQDVLTCKLHLSCLGCRLLCEDFGSQFKDDVLSGGAGDGADPSGRNDFVSVRFFLA